MSKIEKMINEIEKVLKLLGYNYNDIRVMENIMTLCDMWDDLAEISDNVSMCLRIYSAINEYILNRTLHKW